MSETPTNSFSLLGRISPTSNDRARIQRLTEEAEDGKRPIGDARREMRATAGFCGLPLPEQFLYRWEGKELVFWEHPGETPTMPAPELLSHENMDLIRSATLEEYQQDPQQAFWDKQALLTHTAAQAEQIRLLTMRADSADWAAAAMQDELAAAVARADAAEAANKELQEEQDGLHWLTQKHAKILTGVVNALRGTPPPLTLWSHHDAAELAVAMVARVAEQERELSYERQMRQQTEDAMIKLADRVKQQQGELAEQEVDLDFSKCSNCGHADWQSYKPGLGCNLCEGL